MGTTRSLRRLRLLLPFLTGAFAFATRGALADGPSRDGSDNYLPETGPVSIVVKADSVRFTVRIHTEQEVVDYQLYELGEARKLLLDAVRQNGKVTTLLKTPEPGLSNSGRFSMVSLESSGADLSVDLFYPVKEGFDFIACAREVNTLVTGIKIPDKARFKYQVGQMALWVSAPEDSRAQLLKLFSQRIVEMSVALGGRCDSAFPTC